MPYFPDCNVLFIHIPKNAGMYIEKCLGTLPEFDQFPLVLHVEKRLHEFVSRAVRRLFVPDRIRIERLMREFRYGDSAGMYKCQHATLSEIISLRMLDRAELKSCTILAVHRHPMSRVISIYQWAAIHKHMTFDEFCERWILNPWRNSLTYGQLSHIRTQSAYIAGSADFGDRFNLISFENLDFEFGNFCRNYNIEYTKSEPVNKSKSLQVEISDRSLSIIADVYEEDFLNFGYNPEYDHTSISC